MPKVRKEKAAKSLRHNPLGEEIVEDMEKAGIRATPRAKIRKGKRDDDEDGADMLPASMTKKVLEVAQAQKVDEGLGLEDDDAPCAGSVGNGAEDEEVVMEDVEVDEDGFIVTAGATEEEERALSLFLPSAGTQQAGPSLGDLILQKIQEHEARKSGAEAVSADLAEATGLSPKVVDVYTEIGKWLKQYKVGALPKAFKVVPSLTNWEEVLALTSPLTWSPAAMYEAVSIFASNLNPRMAQRFFNLVLLPAVRQNIAEYKKLNFHYYRSLRKSLFKPAAFFKGILLPLATENCTLREALILNSVLSKASIPPMHSAATLMRLCEMSPWYGTTSILMASLLNKKYALPLRVMESLVIHFCAFSRDTTQLPVVWHRTLLVFVQRYKFDLTDDQKRRIRDLLKVQYHEGITPEVRRELLVPKPGEAGGATDMDVS